MTIAILINCVLCFLVTSPFYPFVGFAVLAFAAIMLTVGADSQLADHFILSQAKNWGKEVDASVFENRRFLISVAFLSLSLKIGGVIAAFVMGGAAIGIAICILLASGWLFMGAGSGMTVGLAYQIGRLIVNIYSFVSVGIDRIAEWIAKLELSVLGINI